MSDFKKLKVWRKAHALALSVRRVATRIRGSDNASFRNQIIRAAMSIPTNIVEGTGQKTGKEFARFIGFALNSASELEYHLIMGRDARLIEAGEFEALSSRTIEVQKMLHGLQNTVLVSPRTPRKHVPAS
ncbi:MAG TPA: four helix bundle protein [Gemmatimonadaceae bacterium]|nr:four helix bundle protein [Gemmatimonadaceae bacterium]